MIARPSKHFSFQLLSTHLKHFATIKETPKIPFGIIAALTSQSIIGINGQLPWTNLPADKAHFVNTTRNKVLIIGRKSFAEEDPSGDAVRHARACVVLSSTLDERKLAQLEEKRRGPGLRLARSFEEALIVAQEVSYETSCESELSDKRGLDCWVAGGEDIYKEALMHDNLQEVNLTHVNMELEEDLDEFQKNKHVTFFPLDQFHKIGFHQVSNVRDGICTFSVYRRNNVLNRQTHSAMLRVPR